MSFNSIVLVKATQIAAGTIFKSGKVAQLDRNQQEPMLMSPVAGKFPNRSLIISGTVALSAGFKPDKTYLASITEVEANEYGRQFQWKMLKEVSAVEIIETQERLGNVTVFNVSEKTSEATQTVNQEAAAFDE